MLNIRRPHDPMAELIDELVRTHGRLRSVFGNVNVAVGLSAMESTVLTAVVESAVAPTVPQIGRSLGHARQVIQRAANTLISAGLIETAPNPSHKRAPLLLPTQQGRLLKRQSDARAGDVTGALMRNFDAPKCRRLAGELRGLRGEIESYLRTAKSPKPKAAKKKPRKRP